MDIKTLFNSEKHNVHRELKSIEDITVSDELIYRYNKRKSEMKNPNETILFHGTHPRNIKSIIKNGFDIKYLGINTGNKGLYGPGIYTSSKISTAIYYCYEINKYGYDGNIKDFQLLCCKVLLGNMLECKNTIEYFKDEYDSHYSKDEYVVKSNDQIIPIYILHIYCPNQ